MELLKDAENYLMPNYSRLNIFFERGEGVYLYDAEGKKYLDMLAGIAVNTLGYNHPKLTEAICEQAKNIIHISNLFQIKPQIEVAKILSENSINGKLFFCNSGAEANEAAIKLARKYFHSKGLNKYEFISFKNSFHGRTLATLTATGQPKYQEGFKPLPEGFKYAELNDINSVKELITDKTAGIILEIIQGEGGINPVEDNFLKELYQLTREKDILLIVDEVQTGIGRTGKLFAYQHFDIEPDIITLAKGLGGGVPIGAVIAKEEIGNSFTSGSHGSTFGGNYLATVTAKSVLEEILKDGFLEEVREKGEFLKDLLSELGFKPRGLGLMIGITIPENIKAIDVMKLCLNEGLIVGVAGNNSLRFTPPLIIEKDEIKEGIQILKKVLTKLKVI
ncbi:MAG: aspartate aminotransferase family protein [Persephonella sp.]|nr:MAG: aspartate aminotransferase family protein [Persephonella sp.]